jgi:hypothetical protein
MRLANDHAEARLLKSPHTHPQFAPNVFPLPLSRIYLCDVCVRADEKWVSERYPRQTLRRTNRLLN